MKGQCMQSPSEACSHDTVGWMSLCDLSDGSHTVISELLQRCTDFSIGSDGKESACSARDLGSTLGSGRSPRTGNGYPLQSSCLENPMDRGDWQATVPGVAKSQTQLSDWPCHSDGWHWKLGIIKMYCTGSHNNNTSKYNQKWRANTNFNTSMWKALH